MNQTITLQGTMPSMRFRSAVPKINLRKALIRALGAAFGEKALVAVMVIVAVAAWCHYVFIADLHVACRYMGADALCLIPWACVWAFRETFCEKGGEK